MPTRSARNAASRSHATKRPNANPPALRTGSPSDRGAVGEGREAKVESAAARRRTKT